MNSDETKKSALAQKALFPEVLFKTYASLKFSSDLFLRFRRGRILRSKPALQQKN
jgi:hypothetical protein